jgi:hypothetical protein
MSTDVTEPQPPSAASSEDAEALLGTANSASQHVAVLHVAFMALCAYVLVIVFSTTDMDLLIGKGVKLPVVDVTVPIVGFYAFAPTWSSWCTSTYCCNCNCYPAKYTISTRR